MTALDELLVYAKKHGVDVKWRRSRGTGFWEVWCDGAPLYGDWTPAMLLERLQGRIGRRSA